MVKGIKAKKARNEHAAIRFQGGTIEIEDNRNSRGVRYEFDSKAVSKTRFVHKARFGTAVESTDPEEKGPAGDDFNRLAVALGGDNEPVFEAGLTTESGTKLFAEPKGDKNVFDAIKVGTKDAKGENGCEADEGCVQGGKKLLSYTRQPGDERPAFEPISFLCSCPNTGLHDTIV